MKKKIVVLLTGILLITINLYAEPGDVFVEGKLGVGTVDPSERLDVDGYVKGQSGLCIGEDCRNSWVNSNSFSIWRSGEYGYSWTPQGSFSNSANLGAHTFCALGQVTSDGSNGGWCNIYKSGSAWTINYGKWGNGGITCRAICFTLN
jgi:hypothetical protein